MYLDGIPSTTVKERIPSRLHRRQISGILLLEGIKSMPQEAVLAFNDNVSAEFSAEVERQRKIQISYRVASFLQDKGYILFNPESYKPNTN